MDILIKGMKMPKANQTIEAASITIAENIDRTIWGRLEPYGDWCPIVEVPLHGRLIDADELGNSLERLAADKWNHKAAPVNWAYAFEECLEMVDNAPTIIEQNFIKELTIIPADDPKEE